MKRILYTLIPMMLVACVGGPKIRNYHPIHD